MANYTTNYNLKKPLGSENYNVADQNGNMDLIDAAMKANADAIAKDEEGIAYRLGNTNTTGATLAVGTYVYVTGNTNGVSNGMYKVTTAIAANGSLTTSNLGSVPGGVANSLNSKTTPETLNIVLANSTSTMTRYHAQRIGKMVWFSVNFTTSVQLNAESALFRIDTSNGTNVTPIIQSSTKIIYFTNNEMKFYTLQKSDGKYYVVPANTITANSTVILSGCFVCE